MVGVRSSKVGFLKIYRNLLASPGVYVFSGGALGAWSRAVCDWATGGANLLNLNYSTILVNLVGAFLLGIVVTLWNNQRSNYPGLDRLKFFAGSGFLGAFTTYSSFALLTAKGIVIDEQTWLLAMGVVAAGLVCAVAGSFIANKIWRQRR